MANCLTFVSHVAGLLGVVMLTAPGPEAPAPLRLYVSVEGNDSWSGRLPEPNAEGTDGPFASIERARNEIRDLRKAAALPKAGIEVAVRGGVYVFERALALTAEDSGAPDAPVVYRAFPGEEVHIVGGKIVTGFGPVTDPAVLNRLDESARDKVLQADLKALGLSDFGSPKGDGLELFFQDTPMTLARWPNEGFIHIVDVVEQDGHQIHGIPGSKVGKFRYEGDRPSRWIQEKDPWVHGYWFWDWSEERHPVESINPEESVLTVAEPYHHYGYRKGQWFYGFNLLTELDSPGEWYLDRETGILYFWPPAPIADSPPVVSVLPTLIALNNAAHVTFRGFILECARGTAVTVAGGSHVEVVGCVIRNVGGGAVTVSGGTAHGVIDCDIYQTGGGGISLSGGDRESLTPAGHYAENNYIHHYSRVKRMYHPAIHLHGVGNRAAHNLIHDAPHMAIGFGGNDHVMEFNEIYNVCFESNDAGAIYAGRNWTMRGNVIRHNYLHHISGFQERGCVGVYLDDMFASAAIYGNVFYKVTRAAFIGGGRDCTIENNIFVECVPAVHVDARALGWAHYHADEWIQEAQEKGAISGIAFNKPPYSERYPELVRILEDEPKAPKGNVIARNICWGGTWDEIEEKARPYLRIEDNLIDQDPHFVDFERLVFQLKDDSPAFALGFQRIPIEKIGLYPDDRRASRAPTR